MTTSNNLGPAFQIYQSPAVNRSLKEKTVVQSMDDQSRGSEDEGFLTDLWKSKVVCDTEEGACSTRGNLSKFVIYQSSSLGMQPQIQAKGSAMKTPFR